MIKIIEQFEELLLLSISIYLISFTCNKVTNLNCLKISMLKKKRSTCTKLLRIIEKYFF